MFDDLDRLVVGIKQSTKAVMGGSAEKAFLAHDADQEVTGAFAALCREKNVPMNHDYTMAELGKLCKITVGASVAVIVK